MSNPVYTVFAGINGAGKSSLYNQFNKLDLGERINVDDIAKNLGNQNNISVQIKAGKIAMNKIKVCIKNKKSFNQETVLSGQQVIKLMKELKNLGYKISLNYIGLIDKNLAVRRVHYRVQKGGHDIPVQTILKRYKKSLDNLVEAMSLSDSIKIYDNSIEMRLLTLIENKKIIYKDKELSWFEKYLNEYKSLNIKKEVSRDVIK